MMEKLIIVLFILLISILSFRDNKINNSVCSKSNHSIAGIKLSDHYTYERLLKDGIWWIYVYAVDGSLVNIYPDV